MSVDLGAANPNDGDTVKFTFKLPDGTSRDLTLTATTSATPGAGQFTIGADAGGHRGQSAGGARPRASARSPTPRWWRRPRSQAGNDFFNTDASHPPQRVDGPPFDTATALVDGTAANTVAWYTGDNATDDPRSTALARADQSLTVSYGARANEQGAPRRGAEPRGVCGDAVLGRPIPTAKRNTRALKQRIGAALDGTPNQQKVADIAGQLAGAQVALNNAKDRHDQTNTTLQNLLQSVEGAPTEQVAAQILALQTSLQATLQTTAMLLQTSILQVSVDGVSVHRIAKSPAACRGAFVRRMRCRDLGAAEQARRDLAIDADQRAEMLGLRIVHHRDGLVHHEQADVGDVLANGLRHRIVGVGHLGEEDRPELAVVEQRVVELGPFLRPRRRAPIAAAPRPGAAASPPAHADLTFVLPRFCRLAPRFACCKQFLFVRDQFLGFFQSLVQFAC